MSDQETIHVADVSDGIGGDATAPAGSPVELPVVDVLTGRSFITGKSGSGKSNTASVVIENLLEDGYPVMIVDTDGEYYGLKEEFEILHAGADEECDIVVSPEHAEKIASLALEQNVPIILDVSGYLEEQTANELLLNVVRQLFAKEKKLKKPFLLVVEECHEYIPEGGGMDETGKMLIKVGKRGRKHGLGIVGISQRPADVKKDFITQCDWLCWHRLTWDNDTKVVGRILGSKYADAVEGLDDGEAFLMTDWDESIRRIQFHRKRTFDAGATPGLDDFERPELKSVSGDLVDELQSISDERARRESELAELRQELDKKRARINQLEQELEEARDLSNMADQFAQALLGRAEAPYRSAGSDTDTQPGLAEYDDSGSETGAADGGDAVASAGDDVDTPDGDDAVASGEDDAAGSGEDDAVASGEDDAVESGEDDAFASPPSGEEPSATTSADGSDSTGTEPIPDETDVDPVDPADVAEGALRFDDAIELGTREAVIDELRGRIESLPELSRGMLRHYRREGVSEPIAAHIDAGGNGDSRHAYGRNRPLRTAGLIRHAGRGRYTYAVPDLIREAYANRLEEPEVRETVREVETAFVPPAELDSITEGAAAGDGSEEATDPPSSDEEGTSKADDGGRPTDVDDSDASDGLTRAAKRIADRSLGSNTVDGAETNGSTHDDSSDRTASEDAPSTVLSPEDDAEIIDDE